MKKIYGFMIIMVLTVIMLSTQNFNDVSAKSKTNDDEILFTETVTVYNKTTKFDIGFVSVQFKKNFIPEELYPITFEVELYAEDGEIYIEFSPDVEDFFKDVTIHVYSFEGYIYDVSADDFIYVDVPNFVFKVPHFSRWCFSW